MTRPTKWDLKTWLTIAAFFGVGSFGTFLSQAQRIAGWLAGPTIESHQSRALAHQDSVQAIKWDSLRAWRMEDREAIQSIGQKVDNVAATVAELPGAVDAARRRKARDQAQREITNRALVERSEWRSLKGLP
jgi:hypothetical protein